MTLTTQQQHNKEYYAKHKLRLVAKQAKYRAEHKEEIAKYMSQYYIEHKDEISEHKKKYRVEHKEEINARQTKYRVEHPEWGIWCNMIKRCTNHKNNNYKWYGALGVRVCRRWLNSFDAFLQDMGPRPSKSHSLSRIADSGDYKPGNVVWGTRKQQLKQKRIKQILSRAQQHGLY